MTLDQLVSRAEATLPAPLPRRVVEEIVMSTIAGMGFHVAENGEVCDPRPRPVINYPTDNSRRVGRRARR